MRCGRDGPAAGRVRDAVSPGEKVTYTYDLGEEWEHEITLEKTLARASGQDYRYALSSAATPPSSTGSRMTPPNPIRSTWPRSIAGCPRSAR